jgi:hypothetical protein
MKAGFEQRGKVIAMIVFGLIAIAAFWYSRSTTPTTSAASPTPTSTTSATTPATKVSPTARKTNLRPGERKPRGERTLDPTLHTEWLKIGEGVEYKGGKRNIFSAESAPPPEPTRVVDKGPHCPDASDPRCGPPPPNCSPGAAPDPRCPPPPIPLQFFGFASKPGEPKRIFLKTTDTNDVFVAREGEVVNRRYRILRIMNAGVEIEDVLNNNKQILPLTQG